MRKHLLSFALTLLTLALPRSTFAGTTNDPAKFPMLRMVGWENATVTVFTNISDKPALPPELNNFLRTADTFILFSLGPIPDPEDKLTNTFMANIVLGQATIKRPQSRTCLIDALDKVAITNPIPWSEDTSSPIAAPLHAFMHHGIRATKGDKTIELLFEFGSGGGEMLLRSNKDQNLFLYSLMGESPKATFNWILKRNHVPLPED